MVAYDRLNDRLLYGVFDVGSGANIEWSSPLVGLAAGSFRSPTLALVGTSSGPAVFVGVPDGTLLRGRLLESGWQWEQLASLGAPVVALNALYVPEVGYHIVAATEDVNTFFLGLQGGEVMGPEAFVDDDGGALVQPPFSLVRLGGRTTLLASSIAGGLVSMSRESPGWTSHLLVPDVNVAAVGIQQTPIGVLTLYVDRADGVLYQVIEDDVGSVVVEELATGALASGADGTPLRIATGEGGGAAYVLYSDVSVGALRLLMGAQGWVWSEIGSSNQDTVFLPGLVTAPGGLPIPVGIDLGAEAAGPGVFKLLSLGQSR